MAHGSSDRLRDRFEHLQDSLDISAVVEQGDGHSQHWLVRPLEGDHDRFFLQKPFQMVGVSSMNDTHDR